MHVIHLEDAGRTAIALVGGKAAQLGELTRVEGIHVPAGFCVTTEAYARVVGGSSQISDRIDALARTGGDDRVALGERAADVRHAIEGVTVPEETTSSIVAALAGIDEHAAFAVRSSATTEDLSGASFAGQYDTYLDVVGLADVLGAVVRCWASLFSERAVLYRRRQQHRGFDDRDVRMGVIVQRMAPGEAAGVLFTADPTTSDRGTAVVEATSGPGEALVSGSVRADSYRVRGATVVEAPSSRGSRPTLTDAQLLHLVRLGRRIETHFGRPQDIEWCRAGEEFAFVQARAITTLFPVPEAVDDELHVYVSVGHQQMMTDAMRPLGLSLWQATTPRAMAEAGGRLFVDVAPILATPAGRTTLLDTFGRSDPLVRDALRTVVERGALVDTDEPAPAPPTPEHGADIATDPDPVPAMIDRSRASVDLLVQQIDRLSGAALIEFIVSDIQELRRTLFDPVSSRLIRAGMDARWWLEDHLALWLDERDAADTLTRSVPHDVTAEMGLALLDVADTVRPHAEVVALLRRVVAEGHDGCGFLDELAALPGGPAVRRALRGFLADYGVRCPGEIDVTRTRWGERPALVVPVVLGHVEHAGPGAARRNHEQGLRAAREKEREVLQRLRALPDGAAKAEQTRQMITRVRTFAGFREYPKYSMIRRYFAYKQALLAEAGRLVRAGALDAPDDIYYLRLEEILDLVRTGRADRNLIARRRRDFESYRTLRPPRVITSDGEVLGGEYHRDDVPPGALSGIAVSTGVVEGRARVVTDMAAAELDAGDILVTTYTDPAWTPLFLSAAAVVTEVGGVMTHGAVVAREYGLPGVVGVRDATRLIPDGSRLRVNGTSGYVEILDRNASRRQGDGS